MSSPRDSETGHADFDVQDTASQFASMTLDSSLEFTASRMPMDRSSGELRRTPSPRLIPTQHHTKAPMPDKTTEPVKPQTVEMIDDVVRKMDSIHGTRFYSWIRNEQNIDYIAYHCKRIIVDLDVDAIARGLSWFSAKWSIQRKAELLIKMFYHWGMGFPRFAHLVNKFMQNWSLHPQTIDLVVTLIIGEDPNTAAKFIKYMTEEGWEAYEVIDLVSSLSRRLRWSEEYYCSFIATFAALSNEVAKHERMTVKRIKRLFNARLAYIMKCEGDMADPEAVEAHTEFRKILDREGMLQEINSAKTLDFSLFASNIFELLVLEALEIKWRNMKEPVPDAMGSIEDAVESIIDEPSSSSTKGKSPATNDKSITMAPTPTSSSGPKRMTQSRPISHSGNAIDS